MLENHSEVARLLQQIALEYEAAQRGLVGPAIVANHESITRRMENIEAYREQLAQHVGIERATQLVVEAAEQHLQ